MKYIAYTETADLKTREIVEAVLKHAGQGGIPLDEMRKRNRIWDALDANADPFGLLLEDGDASHLAALVKAFPFGMASRELLKICEAIVDAKAPPAPMQMPRPNGHAEAPSSVN